LKLRFTFITVLLLVLLPGSASAYFFPTEKGVEWRYASTSQPPETSFVIGPVIYNSTGVDYQGTLIGYRGPGPDNELEQIWIVLEDGSVLLGGWLRSHESLGVFYDPPLRMVIPGATLGATWEEQVIATQNPLGPSQAVLAHHEVVELGQRTLPVGTVDVIGITTTTTMAVESPLRWKGSPTGRAQAVEGTIPPEVWTAGLGLVEFGTGTYQLVNTNIDTPVRPTSWGAIKRLYH
jgi:hypothetical protein